MFKKDGLNLHMLKVSYMDIFLKYRLYYIVLISTFGWWFQTFVIFHQYMGLSFPLTNIVQRG